jgi:biotin carboxyl carrier protein
VVPPSPEVDAGPIRVVLGPQLDRFTTEGVSTLLDAEWTVGLRSDRMGLRLEGPAIDHSAGADAISEGIAAGSIQVPGDGRPIALLPARQTIGGYPKIAVVVGADLDRLGQLGPNDTVRFSEVTLAEARRLTVAAAAELGEGAVLEAPRSAAGWDPNRTEMGRMQTVDQWNPEAVERLVRAVAKTEATRFRLELTGAATVRLEWERSSIPAPVEQEREAPLFDPPSPFETPAETDGVAIVTAPLLGVFYRRPDPDTPPFVEEGQQVAEGTVLGLIEVMKTFHEVRSSRRGVVAAFLVEDGATVQFGDPLVRLD